MTDPTLRLPAPVSHLEPWQAHGACVDDTSGATWFPDGPDQLAQKLEAIAICRRCPVTADCLAYAYDTHQAFGIWGGLTTSQRRRNPDRPARVTVIHHGTDRRQRTDPCDPCRAAHAEARRHRATGAVG